MREHLQRWLGELKGTGTPTTLLATIPMLGEPDLTPLLAEVRDKGWRVVVPKVDPDIPRFMRLVELPDSAALEQTRPGPLGTREPITGTQIDLQEIDVALVPGVAFTRRGVRLGRGRGYFDALLGSPQCRAVGVGVAFECQVLPDLPVEPHDATVDWLCTERGVRATA